MSKPTKELPMPSVRIVPVWRTGGEELLGYMPAIFGPSPFTKSKLITNLCSALDHIDPFFETGNAVYASAEEAQSAWEGARSLPCDQGVRSRYAIRNETADKITELGLYRTIRPLDSFAQVPEEIAIP